MIGGTGVNVGNSVDVGMPVGVTEGVQVAGKVCGADVPCGPGASNGPQETSNKNNRGNNFLIQNLYSILNVDAIHFSIVSFDASAFGSNGWRTILSRSSAIG